MKKQLNTFDIWYRLKELGQLCSHDDCMQFPYVMVDEDKPLKWVLEHKPKTVDKEDGRRLTMTVHRGLKPHPTHRCYYHLKKLEGFFDRKYPLKGEDKPLGQRSLEMQTTGRWSKLSSLFKI